MAAVYAMASGRVLNPQPGSGREHDSWDFVSSGAQNHTDISSSKPFSSSNRSFSHRMNDAQPHQTNGTSRSYDSPIQSNMVDQGGAVESSIQPRAIPHAESSYLSPHKSSGFRPPLSVSRSGSEADSLLDLYGRPRSGVESMDKVERPGAMENFGYLEDEDPERSRWIHRDKLLAIESQEMQEAGIKVPRTGKSDSKAQRRRELSHDQHSCGLHNHEPEISDVREVHDQTFEPPPQHEDEEVDEGPMNFDLRTPEEIAADLHPGSSPSVYRQPGLRSSSSRIPLPRDSPLPIPQEHIERSTPIPRKRGASAHWSSEENGIAYGKVRRRSQSVGSLILQNDGERLHGSPTPVPGNPNGLSISPSKSRIAGQPGSRRTSLTQRTTDANKTRSPSTSRVISGQRPKSRSGLEPRPATAINRPEGDPPWLATMFKPDPRLPPEQQLLPTHAKKLQEEQQNRERERKSESETRRDFTPLAVHTRTGLQPPSPVRSHRDDGGDKGKENEPGWPLKQASKPGKEDGSPGGGGVTSSPNAGYSTIPRVHGTHTPQLSRAPSPKTLPQAMEVREREKEKEKERGCGGCCIVM